LGIAPETVLHLVVIEVGQLDGPEDVYHAMDSSARGRLSDEHFGTASALATLVERSQWQAIELLRMRPNPFSSSLVGDVEHQLLYDVIRTERIGAQTRKRVDPHHLIPVVALVQRLLPLRENLLFAIGAMLAGTSSGVGRNLVFHDA
jgi:hypothetical protein